MCITKLAEIENGDSTPLNHYLGICQLQKFRTCHLVNLKNSESCQTPGT